MERLTRKDRRTLSGYHIPTDYSNYHEKEFIKLGKLEDLEEELGIDLITLFNALKGRIYAEAYHYKTEEKSIIDFEEPRLIYYDEWCLTGTCGTFSYCVALKDYGKTWSLRREDLEDE